jgi:hypothetical protein
MAADVTLTRPDFLRIGPHAAWPPAVLPGSYSEVIGLHEQHAADLADGSSNASPRENPRSARLTAANLG